MRRLISADMARLMLWRPFRVGGAFMVVYGAHNVLDRIFCQYDGDGGLERVCFDFM